MEGQSLETIGREEMETARELKKKKTFQGFWCKEEQRKRVVAQGLYGLGQRGFAVFIYSEREMSTCVCADRNNLVGANRKN